MDIALERTGEHTTTLTIGHSRVYFSYSTPVVFSGKTTQHKPVKRENVWGQTTAKHIGAALRDYGFDDKAERDAVPCLPAEAFLAELTAELATNPASALAFTT